MSALSRPRAEDAAAIHELVAACDLAVLGKVDSTLGDIDGRPAGVVIGNDQFVADEGCGYVATLAVLPEFWGRGLGRFLLLHTFAADAARGRKGTILHVGSADTTPALELYLSAGMRTVMVLKRSPRMNPGDSSRPNRAATRMVATLSLGDSPSGPARTGFHAPARTPGPGRANSALPAVNRNCLGLPRELGITHVFDHGPPYRCRARCRSPFRQRTLTPWRALPRRAYPHG
ncbi:GNAT family N-acetyltransferase [Nonomuraea muscovyensis]